AVFFTFVVHIIERPVFGIFPERFPSLCTVEGIHADLLKCGEEALASCRREALPERVVAWGRAREGRLRRWPERPTGREALGRIEVLWRRDLTKDVVNLFLLHWTISFPGRGASRPGLSRVHHPLVVPSHDGDNASHV